MTKGYTDEEWFAIINRAEQDLPLTPTVYRAPHVGSEAFAKTIDHTLLKLDATEEQIDVLCEEARKFNFKASLFFMFCTRLKWVDRVADDLHDSSVGVACVVGFYEGTQDSDKKAAEAKNAVDAGATELDMVMNYVLLKQKQYVSVYNDIVAVRSVAPHPIVLKVILETSQLSPHEIIAGCKIAEAAKADFVKTSTGFNGKGATRENIRLMKRVVGDKMKVKASGGIKTVSDCIGMMEAGAERIGASSGVGIMEEIMTRPKQAMGEPDLEGADGY